MSEPTAPEKPDFIEKIADYAGWILAVSVAVIIAAWSLYFLQFRGSLSDDTATWGQFGDFVGGTLNSVFAFFSFMILLSSLRLQLKELRLTREELEATRKELAASTEAQQRQANHFDKEEKRKYHADAISQFMSAGMMGNLKKFVISIVTNFENGREEYSLIDIFELNAPTHYDIISLGKSIDTRHRERLKDLSERIKFIDSHCFELWNLFPLSPILLNPIREYEEKIKVMIDNGWITDLKFFGKHDFPIR